jgi:RimJ/RimL family protein N-acetyltransferase
VRPGPRLPIRVRPCDGSATIVTGRLSLVPLQVADADDLVAVLGDRRLHEFIGGRPATLAELRDRYSRLVAGPSDPDEVWLNWIVRRRSDSQPVGTVQATVTTTHARSTANVAWVIGVEWQSQGFASEAARALVGWLRQHGADDVIACIHPDHQASAVVARRAGLRPTGEQRDGEQVWRAPDGLDATR